MVLTVFLMVVIALAIIVTLFSAPGFRDARGRMRWAMSLIYVEFGFLHLTAADAFVPIMPPILPFPKEIIWFTGACEIAGGLGLLTPATRRWAGIGLAAYALCVFPANLYHAFWHVEVPGLPSSWWYHAPRLLAQPLLIWWALWAGEVIDWPFGPHRPAFAKEVAEAARAGDPA